MSSVLETALMSKEPIRALEELDAEGTLNILVPEVCALKMKAPAGAKHKDNFVHTLKVVENIHQLGWGDDLKLLMAALLHDIGKVDTRKIEGSQVTFREHEHVGAKLAQKRLKVLGYEEGFISDVSRLVDLHLRAFGYKCGLWEDSALRRYAKDSGDLFERLNVLIKADVTSKIPGKVEKLRANIDDLTAQVRRVQEADAKKALRPALNGEDVMKLLGIGSGPELGVYMKHLKEFALKGVTLSREEAENEVLILARKQERL